MSLTDVDRVIIGKGHLHCRQTLPCDHERMSALEGEMTLRAGLNLILLLTGKVSCVTAAGDKAEAALP